MQNEDKYRWGIKPLKKSLKNGEYYWVIMNSSVQIVRIESGLAWPTIGNGEPTTVNNIQILNGPLAPTRGLI